MAEQMRPASPQHAPDPSDTYERSHPEHESGMGQTDSNSKATPAKQADKTPASVPNAQDRDKQINAHDGKHPAASQPQPDHSMKDEEPLGWDQAPTGTTDPAQKRHPRTEGKGGLK